MEMDNIRTCLFDNKIIPKDVLVKKTLSLSQMKTTLISIVIIQVKVIRKDVKKVSETSARPWSSKDLKNIFRIFSDATYPSAA